MAQIYRKKLLDRLSSPEQLDRMIPITQPMTWLVILGAALICAVVLLWTFTGSIRQTASISGVVTGDGEIVCYVPISEAAMLKAGDPVEMTAVSGTRAGETVQTTVTGVEERIADTQDMEEVLQNDRLVALLGGETPVQEVRLQAPEGGLPQGALVQGRFTVVDVTPFQYAFSLY